MDGTSNGSPQGSRRWAQWAEVLPKSSRLRLTIGRGARQLEMAHSASEARRRGYGQCG